MAMDNADADASRFRRFVDGLARAKTTEGLTQQSLAIALGASQATVSKLLNGRHRPRPALAKRIEAFLSLQEAEGRPFGVEAVARAYKESAEFRRICEAVLMMMNKYE